MRPEGKRGADQVLPKPCACASYSGVLGYSFIGSLHSFGQSSRSYGPDPAASRLFMSSSHELTIGLQNKTRSLDSMHWNECIQDPIIQLRENVHVLVLS